MSIDWSKYGVESPKSSGGIDWNKYKPAIPNDRELEQEKIQAPAASMPTAQAEPPEPTFKEKIMSIIARPKQVAKAALDIVGRPSEIIAEYATPDAPLIGGPQDGVNARQAFLERTGQQPAEGIIEKGFGMIAAPFVVPGASLGLGTELYKAAGPMAARVASRIKSPLGQNVAREALREGAVSGAMGVGQEFAQGSGNAKDALVSGALGTGIGAAAGVAGPLIGTASRAVQNRASLGKAVNQFIDNVENSPSSTVHPPERVVQQAEPTLPKSAKERVATRLNRAPDYVSKVDIKAPEVPEPTNLDDLIKARGLPETTPENIAQVYNTKTWYHGTGTDKLTAETLDPFAGSHESLFGQGVYLTDNPKIAEGYSKSRGKRSKTPTVYESNVEVGRVLDLEKPITPDVSEAILKVADNFDFHDGGNISRIIREELAKPGTTPDAVIQKLRNEVSDFSNREMIPSSEFVENFQDLAIYLKQAGYDGLTHTGGARTGNSPHRVLILLDPQNVHGGKVGSRQVTRFEKYQQQAVSEAATAKSASPELEEVQAISTGTTAREKVMQRTGHAKASAVPDGVQPLAAHPIPMRQANPQANVNKPITRKQVVDNMRKNLGVTIRTGRLGVRDPGVLGYFKIKSEVIRSRQASDLQVISHEIGHHLDKKFNLSDPAYDKELLSLGRHTSGTGYSRKQIRDEGVAEYIRLYLTDPATAQQAAPSFSKYFESVLTPKVKKGLVASQQDVAKWIDQGETLQFRGQVNRTGKDKALTTDKTVEKVYTSMIDKFHPLAVVEKAINKLKTGKAVLSDATESLYKQARLSVGAPKKAQLILKDLQRILKPLDKFGYNMKDLGDYAAAKHAQEIEALGIESGFTKAQIDAVLKKYDTPEMNVMQKQLIMYNNNLLDMLVDAQVLSQEAVSAMRKKYPNYVPFYRYFEEDLTSGFGGGKGFADLTNPIKRLKGSTRDIIDPLESMIKNTFAVVNTVEKNRVGLQLSRLANVDGAGKFVERLTGAESVPKENILTVFENGERVQYQVDPSLHRAMKNMDEDTVNDVVKILSIPSTWLRGGATLTPEFILRNPIRDQFQAFVTSNFGYNPIIDLPMGMFNVLKRSDLYEQWIREGGGYGNYLSQDRNYLREQLKQLRNERNPWAKATVAIVNPKQWLKVLQMMGEFTEEATKVGEFRRGIRKGATPQEAAFQSRDLMDFGRVGNSIKQANRIVTFLNANLQGKDRIARAFINNPVRTTARAVTAITVPAIAAYWWNKNNSTEKQRETLENAPQWLRDMFFLVSVPGTDVVARIPKPFDLAPIYANLPENILRWMDENDPQSAAEFAKGAAVDMAKLPFMLAAMTPLIENATNYKFFTGGPVVPQRDQDLLPEDQYGVTTSLTARLAGKATGTSPYKVDNLIRGYGAGLGRYATAGSDKLLEATGAGKLPPQEEKKISELPVINAFTVDSTGGGKVMDEFYDKFDKLAKQQKSNQKNKVKNTEVDRAANRLSSASRDISELRAKQREIQASFDLSPSEKRKQMDALDGKMNNIARKAMENLPER